jgi:phytoene dehydrogenase-like protein
MKVLVLERLPFLGGRFSTRNIKGFKIPTGAMIFPYGKRSAFQEAFDLMRTPLPAKSPKGEITYRLPHGDYELPKQGGGLYGMLEFALQDKNAAEQLFEHFRRAMAWWEPSDTLFFKEWLSQYTQNRNVHQLFQGLIGAFMGVNSHEMPAGEFFRFLKGMRRNISYGISPKGNRVLMDSLASSLKERGAQIEKRVKCEGILVEKGRVKGVFIEKSGEKKRIDADFVISNCGPQKTVEMAGDTHFEKSYLAQLREHNFTVPIIYLAIGSKEPLHPHHGDLIFGNTKRLVYLKTPSLTCPEVAPKNRHLTITFSAAEYSAGPLNLKNGIHQTLNDLKENFPSFEKEAEIIHLATHHGEWPCSRRWAGYTMPVRTPVENLYNVGDGCMPSGVVGVEACAATAKLVAEDMSGSINK